jgi:2-keto-4-pentenoate hydratase/2-oxohepta-3-ene-1,7-dioic acid hydratase in catechol pathway
MRIVTFQQSGKTPEPGVIVDGKVVSLAGAGYPDVLSLIMAGDAGLQAARSARPSAGVDLGSVKLLAPIPRPGKVICVGLNYRDHAIESGMDIPKVPTIFNKFPSVVIGPGDNIVLPKNSEKPDYEAEFAFVVGRGGRHIAENSWREHMFGYTIVNDVSARDYQMATTQWLMGKTFDTFCPMGPWIVTADEIADPHALDIKMTINGEVLQNSNTRELIFNIPALLSYISGVCTLEPGDIVSTGTPAGVGLGFKPPRWLKAGEECVVTVQGIGELRNRTVAEV